MSIQLREICERANELYLSGEAKSEIANALNSEFDDFTFYLSKGFVYAQPEEYYSRPAKII